LLDQARILPRRQVFRKRRAEEIQCCRRRHGLGHAGQFAAPDVRKLAPRALPRVRPSFDILVAHRGILRSFSGYFRSAAIPDLPTIAESGAPGYEVDEWYGVITGAKVPPAIIVKLCAAITKALQARDIVQRLGAGGAIVAGSTPEQFAMLIKSDIAKWGNLVKEAGLVLN